MLTRCDPKVLPLLYGLAYSVGAFRSVKASQANDVISKTLPEYTRCFVPLAGWFFQATAPGRLSHRQRRQ